MNMPTEKSLQLHEYPEAIALVKTEMLQVAAKLRGLKECNAVTLAHLDQRIAEDKALKNEAARKAAKVIALSQMGVANKAPFDEEQELEYLHSQLQVQAELLINQFTVAKLLERKAIAQMEPNQ